MRSMFWLLALLGTGVLNVRTPGRTLLPGRHTRCVSAHCPVFCSPAKSILCGDVCGEHVRFGPPDAKACLVKRYLKCKSWSPHDAPARIAVPMFHSANWRRLLQGMQLWKHYAKGSRVLQGLVMVVVKCWALCPGTTKCTTTSHLLGMFSLLPRLKCLCMPLVMHSMIFMQFQKAIQEKCAKYFVANDMAADECVAEAAVEDEVPEPNCNKHFTNVLHPVVESCHDVFAESPRAAA